MKLFNFLIKFLFFHVIDPDDGAGSDGGEDLFNDRDDIPEPAKNPPQTEPPSPNPSNPPPTSNEDIDARLKAIEAREAAARQREELNALETDLKAKYDGFEIKKVVSYLQELDKKTPGAGNALFTPKGIELVWKSEFANAKSQEGEFDAARASGVSSDDVALIEKLKSGSASAEDEYKLFGKFA
ncbi:MAG: hypothetical protein LBF71_02645 [Campylobacteraceae bacterium]|jgi:hypothetical protein|nr:hypothetical protein [Campylobacteraceae bacterium]